MNETVRKELEKLKDEYPIECYLLSQALKSWFTVKTKRKIVISFLAEAADGYITEICPELFAMAVQFETDDDESKDPDWQELFQTEPPDDKAFAYWLTHAECRPNEILYDCMNEDIAYPDTDYRTNIAEAAIEELIARFNLIPRED